MNSKRPPRSEPTLPPDDFGLSPLETLAHVGASAPARDHSAFWAHWEQAVASCRPEIRPRTHEAPDPSDPSATHEFESLRHVRIGAALLLPPGARKSTGAIRAGVVALHGYGEPPPLAAEERAWTPLLERGAAVLAVRVRGFPGSRLDARALTPEGAGHELGFVTYGLDARVGKPEDAMLWSIPQAAADVALACRALRAYLDRLSGPRRPLYLAGTSFGAGLAVLAASHGAGALVERLCISLPALGDWAWRLAHRDRCRHGIGGEVWNFLTLHAPRAAEIVEVLRLCDTVVHAARVRCPTLCGLALRDEVVPAPAAAAVFNALACDPGRKWRFILPAGHAEAGVRNARRHALFARLTLDFLDPGLAPDEALDREPASDRRLAPP